MAGRADVKAGGAFVELFLKDAKLKSGLKSVRASLVSVGRGVAIAGAAIAASGAAILSPLAAAVRHFTTAGDELDKMSKRTGVSAAALAELGHAAAQSGTSIEDIEKSIRKMQRTIYDADTGMASAVESLDALGLSAAILRGMKPEDQFQAVADALNAVADASRKSAIAQEIFGRSGTMLLPLLGDMRALRIEARKLGIVITDEQVKAAADLNDAFGRVTTTLTATAFQIGAALAPWLIELANVVRDVTAAVAIWVGKNPQLARTLAVVGVALVALGTTVAILGGGLVLLAVTLGGLASALSFVLAVAPAVIAFLTANAAVIGLVIAAVVLLAATVAEIGYWLLFTKHGQAAMKVIQQAIAGLLAWLNKFTEATQVAFGGIADAISAGDIDLAWQILLKGMEAQWHAFTAEVLKGLAMIVDQIEEQLFGGVLARIADLTGDLSTEAILKEGARGEGLKAAMALIEAKRLAAQAAAGASSSSNPADPSYGLPQRAATVIGTSARAALMSGNVLGTGNNPVVDAIQRMMKFSEREVAILAAIERKTGHRGMR